MAVEMPPRAPLRGRRRHSEHNARSAFFVARYLFICPALILKFVADRHRQSARASTAGGSLMVSWLEKLREGLAEQSERDSDPWRRVLERALPVDVTAVSTVALCNLLGIRPTTGNARRIARTMRALGFFPVKSRKLLPGGWRGTEGRGWARPVRQPKLQVRNQEQGERPPGSRV